jgi:serine/threonine-protein kinase
MADVLPSEELVEEPSDYGALRPGTRLGRYELLVPIARGGMARVWAARQHGQRGFQKLVAIKVILPNLAEEPEFERMFLDEARIASGVHHPNVCEIYELGEEKKTLYLVMEWVSGDSFARVLRANAGKTEAVEPRVVARIVADACAGVHAAHELTDEDGRALGVVHRDLSPHNILITAAGTAKVCDFGVAKALGQLHEATSAGQLKGKIAYMAPEQITGAPVDRRSDVFSLGCVLYEATTGQRPFRGDGDHQVMHAVLKGEIVPPTAILRNYPQELERIVMRALAPQPILRFPTAERMRFSLEEFVARGQLVTQSNVAQVLKTRIGDLIERRKERIRQASSAGDREGGWSEPPGGMTPSNQAQGGHRSGVKASSQLSPQQARPLFSTMQMDRPEAAAALARLGEAVPQTMASPATAPPQTPHMGQPTSSTTIPQASPYGYGAQGQTPVSHPGASYPSHPSHLAARGQGQGQGPGQTQPPPQPQGASNGPPRPPPNPLASTALMPPMASLPPAAATSSSGPPQYGQAAQNYGAFHASAAPQASPFEVSAPPPPLQDPYGPPSTPQAGTGQYVLAIVAGLLVALLIGGAGFLVWRGKHPPPPPEVAVTPVVTAPVGATPSAPKAVTPASAEIAFRVLPTEATLSVEGKELPPGTRFVPRPAIGMTVNVVVHAKGYEDVTVLVDFFTTSPMELTLKSVTDANAAPPAVTPTATATAAPAVDEPVTAAPKDPPKDPPAPKDPAKKPPRPPKDPGVPANPY